ncbi:WUSCHEL-related homeobox 9 [Asimina triloba]
MVQQNGWWKLEELEADEWTIGEGRRFGGGESDGVAASSPARSTVFINNMEFEVGVGPLNVRELFGEEAVLFHSSGQPVLTNEWGVTLHSLQHGAFYYLINMV